MGKKRVRISREPLSGHNSQTASSRMFKNHIHPTIKIYVPKPTPIQRSPLMQKPTHAPTIRHRAHAMPREPVPRVVPVEHVLARHAVQRLPRQRVLGREQLRRAPGRRAPRVRRAEQQAADAAVRHAPPAARAPRDLVRHIPAVLSDSLRCHAVHRLPELTASPPPIFPPAMSAAWPVDLDKSGPAAVCSKYRNRFRY